MKTVELIKVSVHIQEEIPKMDFDLAITPGFDKLMRGSKKLLLHAECEKLLRMIAEEVNNQMGNEFKADEIKTHWKVE